MAERTIPHNRDAELHVVGACLVRPDVIDDLVDVVRPEDFLNGELKAVFNAIVNLRDEGEPVDVYTVTKRTGGVSDGLLREAIGGVPTTGHAMRYARDIVAARSRRTLIAIAGDLLTDAYNGEQDPSDLVDRTAAALAAVDLPTGRLPDGLARLDDLMNRPQHERAPWVIPGLLRSDWRVIIVATEGQGKSLALQQIGMCAAQGIHPFAWDGDPYEPATVLFVDLENPEERIVEGAQLVHAPLSWVTTGGYDIDRAWVWQRREGVNLRGRRDVAEFERVLQEVRPSLVCFGPTYKAVVREKGEGWDEPALAAMRVLDKLRHRHRFALLIEDHAPQATGGVRDLRPYGSSLWLRWPELGLKLVPDEDNPDRLAVGRWRGDRLSNSWPIAIEKSEPWPWKGIWKGERSEPAAQPRMVDVPTERERKDLA